MVSLYRDYRDRYEAGWGVCGGRIVGVWMARVGERLGFGGGGVEGGWGVGGTWGGRTRTAYFRLDAPTGEEWQDPGMAGPQFTPGMAGPQFTPGMAGPQFTPGMAGPQFTPGCHTIPGR